MVWKGKWMQRIGEEEGENNTENESVVVLTAHLHN